MKSLLLSLLLATPLAADEGRWVDPVTSIPLIAKNMAAWNNKPTIVSGATLTGLRKLPSGDHLATFGKPPNAIEIILRPAAHAYYLQRKEANAPHTYQAEVMVSHQDGKLRLYLQSGLTTARHRPAALTNGKQAPPRPPLKATP